MGRFLHGMSPTLAAVLALGVVVSGCSSLGQVTDAEQQQIIATAQAPKLQAGEKIRITVYNEPSLSGDFQIDPSGFVSLPLAGTVKAVGLTQEELERALVQKYASQYLKNPKVTVSVAEYRPFYIIGEVEHPGSFPYTSGLNVLSALAIAGGPTYRASKSTILIQHPGEPALKEYSMDAAVPILPGDIIKVPQRYF
jgi:protein involved in polysaccharide export with SLBB domain